MTRACRPRGVFRQHDKTDGLHASLLLAIMGFLPPEDERIKATVLAIAGELTEDGLVLRYRVEGTGIRCSGEGGTFTICSLLAGHRAGHDRRNRARPRPVPEAAVLRRATACPGDRHHRREHLGNFPQAFTPLPLVEAV